MRSWLDRLFRPFEGAREPLAPAVFRVAFFVGLGLHFAPSLLQFDESFSPGALRTDEWSHWLHVALARLPHGVMRAWAIVTVLACVTAALGLATRASAIVAAAGCYAFASFNGLPVQTLAIVNAWAILILWMICGGGAAALSLDAAIARARGRTAVRAEPRLLSSLVLFQVLLAVFFSGIEKLLAGWPRTNEMHVVLSYPRGFIVRDWVAQAGWLHSVGVGRALSWLTLAVELAAPPLLLVRRARVYALVAYEIFFLGIIAMLEVPPLFYFMFAFGALLALDDRQVAAMRRYTVRSEK
ncbi:MAG TPA: HTTM domain-containing protein [Polyangia bacterium]|nr:HTTM domain-containing protein [Polyangia bacterium]